MFGNMKKLKEEVRELSKKVADLELRVQGQQRIETMSKKKSKIHDSKLPLLEAFRS